MGQTRCNATRWNLCHLGGWPTSSFFKKWRRVIQKKYHHASLESQSSSGSSDKRYDSSCSWRELPMSIKHKETNNDIGLPTSYFRYAGINWSTRLRDGDERIHEIEFLSKLARPEVVAITLIGESHMERVGKQGSIAKPSNRSDSEKWNLYLSLRS